MLAIEWTNKLPGLVTLRSAGEGVVGRLALEIPPAFGIDTTEYSPSIRSPFVDLHACEHA